MNREDIRILVACESSRTVAGAFERAGFDAWSCDILPSDVPSNRHIRGDVRDVLAYGRWDFLMVAHPPCTRLTNAGVRWLHNPPGQLEADHYTDEQRDAFEAMDREERLAFMWQQLDEGCDLFSHVWNADVPFKAIENPVMHKYAKERIVNFRPHSQGIHPFQFARHVDDVDNVTKHTLLWLENLPKLVPTGTLPRETARKDIHLATPGPQRWKERSTFYPGIADAMVTQWGAYIEQQLGLAA